MAISKNILTKKLEDGSVEYIYPITSSDIVEYSPEESVEHKIDDIDTSIINNSNSITSITTIIGNTESGMIKNVNDLKEKVSTTGFNVATTTNDGLISSEDKAKLDGIDDEATKTIIDNSLSNSSENPVKNASVTIAMSDKSNISHAHTTVNGFTVESDVPANAIFTDTTYTVVTNKKSGLMPAEYKCILDNIADRDINDISESDAMTYSSYALNKNYYSKAEIDAIFAQIGWVGTLEDYNSLSIKNPRMIYTTIDTDGTIRRFMGDIELRIGSHLIGYTFVYLNGTSEDTNNINSGSTSYKDITANLKSLHTADEELTSKTTNTLCSNKGGLLIVFILHQSSIEITGDDWDFYQTSQPMGFNETSYLSVYYKYIEKDSPETITVTQSQSGLRLCVNAIIYEGYDNLELINSTSYPAKTDFDLNKVSGGMNIWALHTYELNTATNDNFSIGDNTLAVYGNTTKRIFACVDESGDCANTIHITNSISNANAQDVLCLHLLAIKEDE